MAWCVMWQQLIFQHAQTACRALAARAVCNNIAYKRVLVALGSERSLLDFSRRITVAGMQLRYYNSLMRSLNLSIYLCAEKYLQIFVS